MSDKAEDVKGASTQVSAAGETPPKPSFKPHTVLVLLAILFMAATVVRVIMVVSKQGLESYNISYEIGGAIGVVLWPFVFGWIAYRLFGRSNRAGNIIFAAFLIAGMINLGRDITRQRGAESAKLLQESKALSEQANDAAASGDLDKAATLSDKAGAKLEESGKTRGGFSAIASEYGVSVGKRINELMRVYLAAVGEFSSAGGQACTGLTDAEAIDKRMAVLDRAIEKHDAVLAYLSSIAESMPKDLEAKGVPAAEASKFVRGFMSGGKMDKVIRIHETEDGMLNIFGAKLEILKKNVGKWTCTEGNIEPGAEFPDEELKDFNDLQVKLEALVEEQNALTAELQKKK